MFSHSKVKFQFQGLYWLMFFLLLFGIPQNVYADNPAGCPLTTVNSAANGCYTVTPPPGTVTIDGVLTGAEWTGVPLKDLIGDFSAKVRFKRDGNNLHFLISVDDTVFNAADRVELYFDPLHNHATTTDDILFRIKRGNADHRKITSSGDVPWIPGANLDIEDNSTGGAPPDFATGWAAEVTITVADLGKADLPAILGIAILVHNQNTGNQTSWPSPFPPSADTWANLKTRYPIEYMIVLDQSGSMLSQNKWNDAKKAANFMANAMAVLRDATYFTDHLGVVTFSWSCFANTNETTTPKPLAPIGAFPLGNYMDAAPLVGYPLNCTPIGRGLDEGFSALGTGVEETERVVLLLSDGLHNNPDGTPAGEPDNVPLLPTHLSYNPCYLVAWAVCDSSVVQVNTVALGQDWGVDTQLLTNIKSGFNALTGFASTYNITDDVENLKETFISSLDNLYQMNLASSDPSGTEFTVDANNQKLVVILSWTTPAGATSFSMQQKTNPADPWSNVACTTSATENTTVGYAICIVNNPPSGTWRAVNGAGVPFAGADRQFVLLDLNLRARFAIDQKVHGTGLDIVLTADLNEAGVPVTNDPVNHPVKTTVLIKRPGEGFGTYVSTHTLTSCEPSAPTLPPVERNSLHTAALTSPAGASAAATQPSGRDPKPARFEKIDALFELCDKEGLVFVEEPGIDLYDDGTHGDVTANDGIYTLRFTNTQYEGSYVFRFKASGVSPTGSAFSRVKTIAEYLRVEVDPAETDFSSRVYQTSGNTIIRQFYVIPRDRFKGYLGPGYPDQIQFKTTAGRLIGSLVDHNNGIYSQLLQYDESTDRPVVSAVVQGKRLEPIHAFKAFELVPFVGRFFFDNLLGLDDGLVVGARFGYHITNPLVAELEGGVTFTESTAGSSGNVYQAMFNLRYDLYQLRVRDLLPYVTAGAGYLFFRDLGVDDEAFALHGGVGLTYKLTDSLGIRIDGRTFRINDTMGVGSTTNYQTTAGLVFWF